MNEIPTITINMDDTCMKCFKPGACENGLCMSCSIKPLRNKIQKAIEEHYMNIELIDKAKTEISGLLDNYAVQICKAYTENDDTLTVSLSLKFSAGKPANSVEMQVDISFVESKVKDSVKILVNEKQIGLFE